MVVLDNLALGGSTTAASRSVDLSIGMGTKKLRGVSDE